MFEKKVHGTRAGGNRKAIGYGVFEKNYYPDDHEGKVLSIDAVPAFAIGSEEYEIPEKITGKWIRTNPEKHREQATTKTRS